MIYARITLKEFFKTALNGGEWGWWWAMTRQPGLLEERMSIKRLYSLSFLIYPVPILLVLVL